MLFVARTQFHSVVKGEVSKQTEFPPMETPEEQIRLDPHTFEEAEKSTKLEEQVKISS